MAGISGVSSSSGYSAVHGVGKPNSVRGPRLPDNAIFEQDLIQSGLSADVSTDELLKSVQSSIKSAINDPSNNGKDFFDIIQTAVQKTLEENGVDTEKLTSLLKSQIPDQAGLGAFDKEVRPNRLEGAEGIIPKGPPALGGPRRSPPPSDSDKSFDPSFLSILDDLDENNSATEASTGTIAAQSITSKYDSSSTVDNVASQFKRLISDLIQSLPSGSALDVKA